MRVVIPTTNERVTRGTNRVRRLLEGGKSLWIVNTSDQVAGINSKSILYIHLVDANGRAFHVNLPDTYLPVCLTNEVPHDVLLSSKDFWSYVNKGYITAIRPSKAREILKQPEAQEERARLVRRSEGARGDRRDRKANAGPAGRSHFDTHHPEDGGKSAEDFEDFDTRINNRVIAICGRLEAGSLPPGAAIGELRSIGKLTREDIAYVIGHAHYRDPDNGQPNMRVVRWAEKKMVKLAQRSVRDVDVEEEIAKVERATIGKNRKKGKKNRKKGKKTRAA